MWPIELTQTATTSLWLFEETGDNQSIRLTLTSQQHAHQIGFSCLGEKLAEVSLKAGSTEQVFLKSLPLGQQVIRLHRIESETSLESAQVSHLAYLQVGKAKPYQHMRSGDKVLDAVSNLLEKWDLPGGVLAQSTEGGDITSQPLGWADASAAVPMTTGHRFRAASLGKVITTLSIYQLIEKGKLKTTDTVANLLDMTGDHADLFAGVTVQHLLRMCAGVQVDSAVGAPSPLDPVRLVESVDLDRQVSQEQLNHVLDTATRSFDPGEKFDYHTDNYWLLGRIIERISGDSYAHYVIRNIFQPLGLNDICLATTLPDGRHPDEVIYHEGDNPPEAPQAAMAVDGMVPAPYQRVMPIRDAMGGWLVTAEEMIRLNQHLADLTPHLVSQDSLNHMLSREGAAPFATEWYYGDGLFVQNPGNVGLSPNLTWWHFGLVPGCSGLLARIRGRHVAPAGQWRTGETEYLSGHFVACYPEGCR